MSRFVTVFAFVSGLVLIVQFAQAQTRPLNDTGITFSAQAGSDNSDACYPADPAGQDCHYGRDAAAAAGQLNKVGSGSAGFDFTKISNSGGPLPENAVLGAGANDWACTRDNVTGLVWEVKTASGLRRQEYRYTWYNSNSPDGNPGSVGNTSHCINSLGGETCNTQNYVAAVNAAGLCGAADWRMPTVKELESIVDFGRYDPAIDLEFFPNTPPDGVWSGSPFSDDSGSAWVVGFGHGGAGFNDRSFNRHVRLVRGGQ